MPPRDWAFRIQDILDAIAKIQRYVSGIDFDAFAIIASFVLLMFGMMLENIGVIAGRTGGRLRLLFGIDIHAQQFVLHEFMKHITQELSFPIRTFFFVYLGLLLNFGNLNPRIGSLSCSAAGLPCRF